MIAPAGTKNKVGGNQIHTALVNLGGISMGASLEDMGNLGSSQILNKTLGGSNNNAHRYF
jgi:hypothetical protein